MTSRKDFLIVRAEVDDFIATYKGVNLEGDILAKFIYLSIDEWLTLAIHTYHSEGWGRHKYSSQIKDY